MAFNDKKKPKGKKEATTPFVLPPNLTEYSKISLPILIKRWPPPSAKWEDIVQESEREQEEIEKYRLSITEPVTKCIFLRTESEYLQKELFGLLIPALEETLEKAKKWQVLKLQKCFFNGVDHIAQVLWNNNPRYPIRQFNNSHIFNMKWAREHLREHPRPYYPKSWLWPEEYAATVIQKTVRQYFVQRQEEVQEMRDFWKKLVVERDENYADKMEQNPFLAKKFASTPSMRLRPLEEKE